MDCDSCKNPGADINCETCPRIYHSHCLVKGLEDVQLEHQQCRICFKYGTKAVQVVNFSKTTDQDGTEKVTPVLDIERIEKIIKDSKAESLPVVIIAVAGVARSGKSFLLSLLIDRNIHQIEEEGKEWPKSKGHITGFNWAPSDTAVTFGMLMWEKAFITKLKDGTKVAMIYMDTQGTGDRVESTNAMTDTQIMFLSLELSAIQINNIDKMWRVEDAQIYKVCQLFSEQISSGQQAEKPFNSLVILYRNWQADRVYGHRENYYDKEYEKVSKNPAAEAILKGIKASFNCVEFVMLPGPGNKVIHGKGQVSKQDIKKEFLNSAESLFQQIFAGQFQDFMKECKTGSIVIKQLEELKERLEAKGLPSIASPADHLSDSLNAQAHAKAMAHFKNNIQRIKGFKEEEIKKVNFEQLDTELEKLAVNAIEAFDKMVSKSSPSYTYYLEKLKKDLSKKKASVRKMLEASQNNIKLRTDIAKNVLFTEQQKALSSWDTQLKTLNQFSEIAKYRADMEYISKKTLETFVGCTSRHKSETFYSSYKDDLQKQIKEKEQEKISVAEQNQEMKRIKEKLEEEALESEAKKKELEEAKRKQEETERLQKEKQDREEKMRQEQIMQQEANRQQMIAKKLQAENERKAREAEMMESAAREPSSWSWGCTVQ